MFDECPLIAFELNTVPSVEEFGLDVDKDITLTLTDDSYVFTGENPGFPELTSATYTRTGIKNQWGTIVVPFTFTTDDAKGYEFYTLASATSDEITLAKVENGTNVVAGTPMIVRVKSGSELTLTASTPAVTVQIAEGSATDGLQLAGTYEAKVISPADYFIANNMFWNAGIASAANDGAQVKVNPFRAYLKSTGAAPLSQSLAISVADEDATGAAALNAITSGTAEYYDMNGRKLDSLQQGVNIVKYGNGVTKKIIIKGCSIN